MELSFSSLTEFKPVPGQTLKGGRFCILLRTDQTFTDEIQIQSPWNVGDCLLVCILVETTINCGGHHVCTCLLDWSVGTLKLGNVLYS